MRGRNPDPLLDFLAGAGEALRPQAVRQVAGGDLAELLANPVARRIGEHGAALASGPDLGSGPLLSGAGEAVLRPSKAALDTLGLLLEATP